ncbi:uncharacterized protein LOC116512863 [Thamnophis elegans]|uniref:uncharacterized protein LOC116512863 n=1 Tax=Thamnophis elegans TaxID=35005 RepID=UPI0013782E68|nr:uncharacterized protein LOC116512863 [Thamnophis elegans]
MPKRKAARPLRALCLENVAANMQQLWAKDYVERSLDEQRFRYVLGPFSDLAGCLVQELIEFLGIKRRVTRPVLHLLLVPQLTELHLRRCSQLVTKDVAQMISSRCKNLSVLNLDSCSRIPSDALVSLIESLPSLKKLDLSDTQCNTQVLSAVGSTCRHLSELNITDCKRLSAESLFHLAYDVTAGSFSCQGLQLLLVDGLEPSGRSRDLIWALAFVLLALPSLLFVENEFVSDALQEILDQQFAAAQVAPRFPSLKELVQRRMAMRTDQTGSRLTLPLKELLEVEETFLPTVCAVCPHLTKAVVLLDDGSALSPAFYTWRTLTNLTLDCSRPRNLAELLPVAAVLGAQMQFLSVDGFYVRDELSFHTLLNRCPNLQKFTASIFLSLRGQGRPPPEQEAVLTPPRFSHLTEFTLSLCHLHTSAPSQPIPRLRANLLSVLQNSPCLETLELFYLPFGLDEVFEKVLEPRGAALVRLCDLFLLQCQVSISTIHLLLAADNQLNSLHLDKCPDIYRGDYEELLRKVSREGLDLHIEWQ